MPNIKESTEKLIKKLSLLDKRQKTLLLLLVATVCFGIYYNLIYKTQAAALSKARIQLNDINKSLGKLNAQFPNIDMEKRKLDKAKRDLAALESQLANIELELPTEGTIPQLLDGLVKQAQGYSIDFTSIRPKPVKEKVSKEEATAAKQKLEAAGAIAEIS